MGTISGSHMQKIVHKITCKRSLYPIFMGLPTYHKAKYVAGFLLSIFTQFGAPTILQSDNGKEFMASIIKEIVALWPSTKIINGRPRHPQSQGLIEKGNDVLEVKLSSWLEENKRNDWSTGLPFVICKRCKAIDIIII